ncbi:MAG: molybdate ABC transporter substrate-binding protein [Anaerolineae bacterium]|nr:molybdate ABC transporter substrate-binding protein [Anaerolineae bacterium]
MKHRLGLLLVAVVLLSGFAIAQAQSQGELTVFAAASLTDAYAALADAFEAANPGVHIVYNFGGSSTLATQLVQGAPADVFASANNPQMTVAIEGGRIAGSPRTFAKNRLILIVPVSNPADIHSLRDLATPGISLILAAPDVPVRVYTDTMLERMANDPAYGSAYRDAVLANLVSEEPNVRQVSAKVALGEADAGVVYMSDVTPDIMEDVIALPIPDVFNTIATYPIALTNDTQQPELAQRFVDFVIADAGQDILVEWGFISVRMPVLPETVTLPTDGTLLVDGQVLNPLSLTVERLRADYAAQTVAVSYLSDEETVTASFTGALLWDVISAAQPNMNVDLHNDWLSLFVVVTGADGYQAVIAWGEIDPAYSNQPILIAYAQDGSPIADELGALRLVVPGDGHGGRYVRGVVNLSLRDAPAPPGSS